VWVPREATSEGGERREVWKLTVVRACPSCGGALELDDRFGYVACPSCGWRARLADSHRLTISAERVREAAELLRRASLLTLSDPVILGRIQAAIRLATWLAEDLEGLAGLRKEAELDSLGVDT